MSRRRLNEIVAGRDPMVFAENVRLCRENLGWTRQRLCAEAGVSPQTLTKIERGQACTPGVERKLTQALGTFEGRLWETFPVASQLVHRLADDRWYFADVEDGERYRQWQNLAGEPETLRLDPDSIQDPAERNRLGWSGLSRGFGRITTAHLEHGTAISSVLELFGTITSNVPDGRFAYFYVLRGAVRFRMGKQIHELATGDVLQLEMESPSSAEPLRPVAKGEEAPQVIYVDVGVKG